MRSWRTAATDPERVFLYFREHPNKFLTEDHVAANIKLGRRRTRKIVAWLVREAKLEVVDTVSSFHWGRPKKMFRAIRSSNDSIFQLELVRNTVADAGFEDPSG